MQIQPHEYQAPAGQDDLQQLATLFAAQQMITKEVDAIVLQESQKTLEVFQEAIGAAKAETQGLMLENASLRERLAAMEAQMREYKVLHTEEAKAKDARHVEEIAALEDANKRQQRVVDALDKAVQEHTETYKKSAEQYDPNGNFHDRSCYTAYTTFHTLSVQQHERAKLGVYQKRPTFSMYNGVVHYSKE